MEQNHETGFSTEISEYPQRHKPGRSMRPILSVIDAPADKLTK